MIVGAQTLAAPKIGAPTLMQPQDHIDSPLLQQCNLEKRAKIAVGQHDVPLAEVVMQSAEQSRFAGFFAPIAPQSTIQDGAHSQRENDEQTRQRKTQTRLLALGLRIGRLV